MSKINEATRQELINKSKSADKTKSYSGTRYERRLKQRVFNPKNSLNKLDQNALWKSNSLNFFLNVHGETDDYVVSILFDDVLGSFKSELKRNNYEFEYKVIYRALINAINRSDIYVSCTCADWFYTMSYQSTKGQYNAGQAQIIPAKIRNPRDTKGAGCKHVLKVLADLSWALDLASCITNYVYMMEDKYFDKYKNIIFPELYGMSYERALDQGIISNEEETFEFDELTDDESNDDVETEDTEEIEDEELE